jgi:hypothetical protein
MRTHDLMRSNGVLMKIMPAFFALLALVSFVVQSAEATAAPDWQGRVSQARAAQSSAAQPSQSLADDRKGDDKAAKPDGDNALRFDVAEIVKLNEVKRFVFDNDPLFDDGLPAYGNEFITEGYIYLHGTLSVAADGKVNGVNADGSPEFPDKVIGRWICRGWHTGDGARTVTGDWVVTHQLYIFGDKLGKEMLATDGLELVDVNVPIQRAIIGGTGQYARARGEATQTMLGFNLLGGVGLRYEIKVTR